MVSASQDVGLDIQVILTFQHHAYSVSTHFPGTEAQKIALPFNALSVWSSDSITSRRKKKSKSVGAKIMVLWKNHLEFQLYLLGYIDTIKNSDFKETWGECVTAVVPQLCVGLYIVLQFEVCHSFHQSHTNRVRMKPNLWTTLGEVKL